jgi:hypothetical protein
VHSKKSYYRYIENTQAKEEGRAEERLKIARTLKQMNVTLDTIVKASNLTKEEIEKL